MGWFTIHSYLMNDEFLSLQEKCVFAYIEGFCTNPKNPKAKFYASNEHIGSIMHLSKRRISQIVNSLVKKQYIYVNYEFVEGTKAIKHRHLSLNYTTYSMMKKRDIEESCMGGIEESCDTPTTKPSTNTTSNIQLKIKKFDFWWSLYNKKIKSKGCKSKFVKLSLNTIEQVIKHTKEYVKHSHLDGTYPSRKHPMTYLNKESWNDEIEKVAPQKEKLVLEDFSLSTTGRYIAYCEKCKESSFHDRFTIRHDSPCCNAKLLPQRKAS